MRPSDNCMTMQESFRNRTFDDSKKQNKKKRISERLKLYTNDGFDIMTMIQFCRNHRSFELLACKKNIMKINIYSRGRNLFFNSILKWNLIERNRFSSNSNSIYSLNRFCLMFYATLSKCDRSNERYKRCNLFFGCRMIIGILKYCLMSFN